MQMKHVLMFYLPNCPSCAVAELLLKHKGVKEIEKIKVEPDPSSCADLWHSAESREVPQIFIGATHVGGLDELLALNESGRLGEMLRRD